MRIKSGVSTPLDHLFHLGRVLAFDSAEQRSLVRLISGIDIAAKGNETGDQIGSTVLNAAVNGGLSAFIATVDVLASNDQELDNLLRAEEVQKLGLSVFTSQVCANLAVFHCLSHGLDVPACEDFFDVVGESFAHTSLRVNVILQEWRLDSRLYSERTPSFM